MGDRLFADAVQVPAQRMTGDKMTEPTKEMIDETLAPLIADTQEVIDEASAAGESIRLAYAEGMHEGCKTARDIIVSALAARTEQADRIAELERTLRGYEVRRPINNVHLASLPTPTGDYETDLAQMAEAITDEMLPPCPPTWGFVQWEISPPDHAVALFSLEAGLRAENARLKALRDEAWEDVEEYETRIAELERALAAAEGTIRNGGKVNAVLNKRGIERDQTIQQLEAENARMREALEFYGSTLVTPYIDEDDEFAWLKKPKNSKSPGEINASPALFNDQGERARKALEGEQS